MLLLRLLRMTAAAGTVYNAGEVAAFPEALGRSLVMGGHAVMHVVEGLSDMTAAAADLAAAAAPPAPADACPPAAPHAQDAASPEATVASSEAPDALERPHEGAGAPRD